MLGAQALPLPFWLQILSPLLGLPIHAPQSQPLSYAWEWVGEGIFLCRASAEQCRGCLSLGRFGWGSLSSMTSSVTNEKEEEIFLYRGGAPERGTERSVAPTGAQTLAAGGTSPEPTLIVPSIAAPQGGWISARGGGCSRKPRLLVSYWCDQFLQSFFFSPFSPSSFVARAGRLSSLPLMRAAAQGAQGGESGNCVRGEDAQRVTGVRIPFSPCTAMVVSWLLIFRSIDPYTAAPKETMAEAGPLLCWGLHRHKDSPCPS